MSLPSSARAPYRIHVPAKIAPAADPTIKFFIVMSSTLQCLVPRDSWRCRFQLLFLTGYPQRADQFVELSQQDVIGEVRKGAAHGVSFEEGGVSHDRITTHCGV